jgi:hypothetical protein
MNQIFIIFSFRTQTSSSKFSIAETMQSVQNREIEYIFICMFANVSLNLHPDHIWDISAYDENIMNSVKLALTDKLDKNKIFMITSMWRLIKFGNSWLDIRPTIKGEQEGKNSLVVQNHRQQ